MQARGRVRGKGVADLVPTPNGSFSQCVTQSPGYDFSLGRVGPIPNAMMPYGQRSQPFLQATNLRFPVFDVIQPSFSSGACDRLDNSNSKGRQRHAFSHFCALFLYAFFFLKETGGSFAVFLSMSAPRQDQLANLEPHHKCRGQHSPIRVFIFAWGRRLQSKLWAVHLALHVCCSKVGFSTFVPSHCLAHSRDGVCRALVAALQHTTLQKYSFAFLALCGCRSPIFEYLLHGPNLGAPEDDPGVLPSRPLACFIVGQCVSVENERVWFWDG